MNYIHIFFFNIMYFGRFREISTCFDLLCRWRFFALVCAFAISFTFMKQMELKMLTEFIRFKVISDLSSLVVVDTADFGEQGVRIEMESTAVVGDRRFLMTKTHWSRFGDVTFCAYESLPVGVVSVGGVDVDLMNVYEESPSEFPTWCCNNNVEMGDVERLQRYPNDLRHIPKSYLSQDEAVKAVLDAVEQDKALVGFRKVSGVDFSSTLTEENRRYWKAQMARLELGRWKSSLITHDRPPSLFDDKVDYSGDPLPESTRKAILRFLNEPTLTNWKVAGECPITPTSTLYQAIYMPNSQICINFKPDYTKPVPCAEDVESAMLVAVAKHNEKCRLMVEKFTKDLKSIECW